MKTNSFILLGLSVALASYVSGCACCRESKTCAKPAQPAAVAKPTEEEMMKKWMEAATPGAPHKLLDAFVGEWNVASKWWMDPQSPPMESKGTSSKKWILDGRFLQEDFNGEMMGQPFKGTGLTGYDNMKRQYNSSWVDSSTTSMLVSLGAASADGKTFTFDSKMDDCMTGEKDKPVRFVLKVMSKDQHVFEMFDLGGGSEKKVGEMTYTRKS